MFSKCLELAYFPSVWKKGKIKVLNKVGEKPPTGKDLRPINLLPALGEVMEKMINFFLE